MDNSTSEIKESQDEHFLNNPLKKRKRIKIKLTGGMYSSIEEYVCPEA